MGNGQALPPLRRDHRHRLGRSVPPPGGGVLPESRQKGPLVHVKDRPVDSFEFQGVVVEIAQLHQGVPGRVNGGLLGGEPGFQPGPALLGRGQGVVAVPTA